MIQLVLPFRAEDFEYNLWLLAEEQFCSVGTEYDDNDDDPEGIETICHCSEDRCHHEVVEVLLPSEARVVTYDDLIEEHHQELMVRHDLTPSFAG